MAGWNVKINDFLGGFAPAWYKETYPSYGNPNMAGDMTNIDLTNPGYLTQGPAATALTNGTQDAAVTTTIKGILSEGISNYCYGVGGAKLYQFTNTTVTNAGDWPHTIDKAAVTTENGYDVAYYQGDLYYSYTHSGSGGDIGKFDLSSTFDDDWGSTVPTGAATLDDSPHPMCVAGNDYLYIGNGRYVTSYDGSEFIEQALDLPENTTVVDLKWMADRLWITTNKPYSEDDSYVTISSIFVWDGTTNSWEIEIPVPGTARGSFIKNGTLFQFYGELPGTEMRLGYVSGGGIVEVASFEGDLPYGYSITESDNYIMWVSDEHLYMFGTSDSKLPVQMFNIADVGQSTGGGISTPFGTPIVASWNTSSAKYQLAKLSGYDTNSSWKSMLFDITGDGRRSAIDYVRINFETLATGARVDWSLVNNQGTTIYSDTISNAKFGASTTTAWYPIGGKQAENFRVQFDFSNGSATNPVKIKNVRVYGSSE